MKLTTNFSSILHLLFSIDCSSLFEIAMDRFVFLAIIALCIPLCCLVESAPKGSLVSSLPGFNGSFPSKHYAGYVHRHFSLL